jgi:hypothetical protein
MAQNLCVRTDDQLAKYVSLEIMLLALALILILTFAFFLSFFSLAPTEAEKPKR